MRRTSKGQSSCRRRLCAVCGGALAVAVYGAPPAAAPPPPVTVTVAPADRYPRCHVRFEGVAVSEDGREATSVRRDWQAAVLPNPGEAIVFAVTAAAKDADRTVRATFTIHDYAGRELKADTFELPVKAGETQVREIEMKPGAADEGPFYLTGEWTEAGGAGQGTRTAVAGMPSVRLTVEDFEQVRAVAGVEVNTAAARHGGRMGLSLRPPPPANPPPPKEGVPPPPARYSLKLGRELPGRPVRLGVWVKTAAPAALTLRLRDPGVEVSQAVRPDVWLVGPVAVPAGDWQYVVFPAPDYGRPRAQLRSTCEADGIVDYPLTLESLEFECPPGAEIQVDDVDVWTQLERAAALRIRPILDKPADMLYPNDTLRLAFANAWLWEAARTFQYAAALTDIAGRAWPLGAGAVTIEPGGEAVVEPRLVNLPFGSYRLAAELRAEGGESAALTNERPLVVYQPSATVAASYATLLPVLADRNRFAAELGFRDEILLIPWHSVDGAPAVENPQGFFDYEWIDPEVQARAAVGLNVVGRLGFTSLWADPDTTYYPRTRVWMGNVYTLPSQSIYWEEYVQRTVRHYAGRIRTWVVWERPDSEGFSATPRQFTEQILAVARAAATEADPGVKLVSGGVLRENLERYLEGLIRSRAGRYLDAVGVVPSTAPLSPEDGYMDIVLARAERLRAKEHFAPPLWALDLGWPTGDGEGRVDEEDQARYLARAYALCRARGVEKIIVSPYEVPRRDAAGLLFEQGGFFGIKPAALVARTAAAQLADATFEREAFLLDRRDGLARAYLFRKPDGRLLLAAWRTLDRCRLRLPEGVQGVADVFGNTVALDPQTRLLELNTAPHYIAFAPGDPAALLKQLERAPVAYADAPESGWKSAWSFFLDVGDPADEAAAHYAATSNRVVGPLASHYHNDYGRYVVDAGRHFTGEERFTVDVSAYGASSMILRKRINYSSANQLVKVYCNDQLVGQWLAFKRARRYFWRDLEYVIPNRFFAGSPTATLRFEAQQGEATSYAFWAAPLKQASLYVSDLSLLVASSGYGPGINRDLNILGGPLRFFKGDGAEHAKGLGTNAAETMDESLVVVLLNRQFKRLRGQVGVDAAANGRGSVRFRVNDGTRVLYDSKDMTYFSEPQELDIDVSDSILLMLSTEDAGDGRQNDLANWAGLRLELK